MSRISVFDMFKIGVGPSSSHTMGPWRAAERFVHELHASGALSRVSALTVDLFGSLAKTGKGHGTYNALLLGLSGEDPVTIDTARMPEKTAAIAAAGEIALAGEHTVPFRPEVDIRFLSDQQLALHPNALRFVALVDDGSRHEATYFSVGGGFLVREGESSPPDHGVLPHPIGSGADLLAHCEREGRKISEIVLRNELTWREEDEVRSELAGIWQAMLESVYRGCHATGELPGGLHVKRRAAAISRRLLNETVPLTLPAWVEAVGDQRDSFRRVLEWVSCFALAVNEENAAFGRVVTAPTNGAAGVVPAVLLYHVSFCGGSEEDVIRFLLTAGELGSIFKKRATISAALGGCQAEIGVSSSMAAAALTECLGGSAAQCAAAAEIAMEHHLGLTCDPVGGFVQIPCIERNSMGAIKAIMAANLGLQRDPSEARVSLDDVILTMWETANDMSSKYKETGEGGLALNISVNLSEC